MKKLLLILLLSTTPAAAQNVTQSGFVTPGHAPMIITNGVIGDGGTAAQGFFTGLGTTASGPSICANSGLITALYNQVCIGATSSGGILSFTSYNGATGSLAITGNISLPALAGAVQCLQTNISGVVTGTGSACGAGGGGGGTPGGLTTQLQFNNSGTFGGITGVVTNDGASIVISSGGLNLAGSVTGTTQLNASATASGTLTLPVVVTDTLTANAASQTLTNKTLTAPTLGGTIFGSATFAGNFAYSGTNNFQIGSFQFNGNNQTFPVSGNIVGAGDTQTLTNKSINGSEINSGVVLATFLPVATAAALGVIQGDGSTLTISGPGVASCTTATASQIGCSRPDNSTIQVSGGVLTVIGAAAATISINSTAVTSGTPGDVLVVGAGPLLQQLAPTGTGSPVFSASPTLSGTVGGALTFSGNITLGGTLTAASLATPGVIGGAICASSGGAIFYNSGSNCFGAGVTALNSLTGSLSITAGVGIIITPSSPNIAVAVSLSELTNSIGGNVGITVAGTFFDGPSVAQGTSGTWYASGTVGVQDPTTTPSNFTCKLWDGTTVIASGSLQANTTGASYSIALSGILASPAANIRISCTNTGTTTGRMNASTALNATTKASTVSAVRIQ